MAGKPRKSTSGGKQPAAIETSLTIEEQTKAFLAGGGEIEEIGSGVSGQQSMAGPKHISLGNSKPQPQVQAQPQAQPQAQAQPQSTENQ